MLCMPEPQPWAGQRLGAQVLGKSRSGTPKRCFRRSFLSISTHAHYSSVARPATNARGVNQYQGRRSESISRAGWQRLPYATATRSRTRRKQPYPGPKNAFYWDFHSPKMTKTHIKNVRGADQKRPNFCFRYFPQISTLLEIPRETPWKIAENRTLKWGSSPLPAHSSIACHF
jgi:hypothetical protein